MRQRPHQQKQEHEQTNSRLCRDGHQVWASHFQYLRECFKDQVGVSMWRREPIEISSWNNVQIARGYEKVVVTWQGLWWELTYEDVNWDNLDERIVGEKGVKRWETKGVNVFQFARGFKHDLKKHRFAVFPSGGEAVCRDSMRPDRYYIHVYQTKIKNSCGGVCWLRSREIAQFSKHNWRQTYHL